MPIPRKQLVEFIRQALSELTNKECPNCQCEISPDNYVTKEQIDKWINQLPSNILGWIYPDV